MLKFETSYFQYIVVDTGFPSDNTIISYNDGDMLYLDKTKTEGFYFAGVSPISRVMPLHRVRLDCLLLDDKVYTMKEEPQFYA